MKRDNFSCINEWNSIEFIKILPLHRNDPQGFAFPRPKNLRENKKKKPNTHLFLLDGNGQGA